MTTVTIISKNAELQNWIHREYRCGLKSGNAYCHLVQNLTLQLGLLCYRAMKLCHIERRTQTEDVWIVCWGSKRKEVTGAWRKLHSEWLHDLQSSQGVKKFSIDLEVTSKWQDPEGVTWNRLHNDDPQISRFHHMDHLATGICAPLLLTADYYGDQIEEYEMDI